MANRSKLEKFAENLAFPNVFENSNFHHPELFANHHQKVDYKSKWVSDYFKNKNPLVLELACGRGEYSLGLARMNANINIIGIDIKGARIWKGASTALQENLNQVAFLRSKIELLPHFFSKDEVDEIWITFPDPFPRPSKANKRLMSTNFLDIYSKILKNNALLHLKTDVDHMYTFGLETIAQSKNFEMIYHTDDIYKSELYTPELEIKTYYERMHMDKGKTIKYIRFRYLDLEKH